MSAIVPLFVVSAVVAAGLAWLAIWSPRRPLIKVAALALAALLLPLGYLSLVELTGRPKEVRDEWLLAGLEEAQVLAFDLREGRAIFLWLRLPGIDEPRSYRLPWSLPLARQLQEAGRAAERAGTAVAVRRPFERSLDDQKPRAYPLPQPASPPKQVPGEALVLPPRTGGAEGPRGPGRTRRGRSAPGGPARAVRPRGRPWRRGSASASRSPAPPTGGIGGPAPDPRAAARP